jgi:ubiquitin-activating enzyme E1 C
MTDRNADLITLIRNEAAFYGEGAEGFSQEDRDSIPGGLFEQVRVLIVGAGGLGCEMIKQIALMGVKNIDIVDLDTIDVTNLNRQFLFRQKDIGLMKAEVCANFIMTRFPGTTVNWHSKKIQEYPDEFFQDFNVFVAGLDNKAARSWLNKKIHSMVTFDSQGNPEPWTQRIMIDGGTEIFSGQARVIRPFKGGACYDCLDFGDAAPTSYQICTIANVPRLPEHCIAYAFQIEWPDNFPDRNYDTDCAEDMIWINKRAEDRARMFGIEGVNFMKTMGVVKNIVPAIVSTNAGIAAICCQEFMKAVTSCAPMLNNWMGIHAKINVVCQHLAYPSNPKCETCRTDKEVLDVRRDSTVQAFVDMVGEKMGAETCGAFSITDGVAYWYDGTAAGYDDHQHKLAKTVGELTAAGGVINPANEIFVNCKGITTRFKANYI